MLFVLIWFVGFDYIEHSLHGLRCISSSNVCRAVFCGHSEPCWRGCGVQQCSSQQFRGHLDLALCSLQQCLSFLFPFFGVAIMSINARFCLALFFLGLVIKASVLDGIWGQNKASPEEFQHKNWYCILLIELREVKQHLYFQISTSTTANAAGIVLLSVHGYNYF